MNAKEKLQHTLSLLMCEGKGVLAADESDRTVGKRLALAKLPDELQNRRDFRRIMLETEDIERGLSGVILFDATFRDTIDGISIPDMLAARGILAGIKVDVGTVPFPGFEGELLTEGIDGLSIRLRNYMQSGAVFTKWRAVFPVIPSPSIEVVRENAHRLALFARMSQDAGLVPVIEPEVLFDGTHTQDESARVIALVLREVTEALATYRVDLRTTILKTSMALPGKESAVVVDEKTVADVTMRTLHVSVPYDIGGILFLSGGQTPKDATRHLHAIVGLGKQPWPISFSFSRALEEPLLHEWKGKNENIEIAQKAFRYRVLMNSYAQKGQYDAAKDNSTR